jgi:uncharacterized protein YggE
MNKFKQIVFILLSLFLVKSFATNVPVKSDNVIEVTGKGSVELNDEGLALQVTISKTGRNTNKIRAFIDSKSVQVINVAKNLGVTDNNIVSLNAKTRIVEPNSNINIQGIEVNKRLPQSNRGSVYVGVDSLNNNNNQIQNFELRKIITIHFLDIEQQDQFLSQTIKMGIEAVYPISTNSDEDTYQKALKLAIENAKMKAKNIAIQSDVTLGKLIYLKELSCDGCSSSSHQIASSYGSHRQYDSSTSNKLIIASVLVKFTIKP